jgi:hypothetical protein
MAALTSRTWGGRRSQLRQPIERIYSRSIVAAWPRSRNHAKAVPGRRCRGGGGSQGGNGECQRRELVALRVDNGSSAGMGPCRYAEGSGDPVYQRLPRRYRRHWAHPKYHRSHSQRRSRLSPRKRRITGRHRGQLRAPYLGDPVGRATTTRPCHKLMQRGA